jgi:hypothetical protein
LLSSGGADETVRPWDAGSRRLRRHGKVILSECGKSA